MSSKPMTEYINHKYPVAEKPIHSVLTQVNDILTRVSNIEQELKDMRNEANTIGKDYLEQSMVHLKCGAPYEMLPELARQSEYFESDGVKGENLI